MLNKLLIHLKLSISGIDCIFIRMFDGILKHALLDVEWRFLIVFMIIAFISDSIRLSTIMNTKRSL